MADNPKYSRHTTEGAFTLIELMVAMVVMSLGLFAIIHMQVITVRGHAYARERSEATQIALGVADQTRKKGLEWITFQDGTYKEFTDVFKDEYTIILKTPPPDAAAGDNLSTVDLHSVLTYCEDPSDQPQPIAGGTDFVNAWKINTYGYSQEGGALPVQWAGAMYRVHYIAHFMDLPPPAQPRSLVRMTVIVSWDNKDHGEGTDWAAWATEDNFWRRHMVTATFYMSRQKSF